jgi:hypothetical protein
MRGCPVAIDFGLGLQALQAFGNDALRRQQMALSNREAQLRDYGFKRQQQQDTARDGLAGRVRSGDYQGARRDAALAGDFDFATAIGGLHTDQLQEVQRGLDAIGTLHTQLKALPAEQRAAAAMPVLRQLGVSDDVLANADWSDAWLDGIYASSASGKAQLTARIKAAEEAAKPYTLNRGDERYVGGELVAKNNEPPPADWIWDSDGGNWLQKPGTGGMGQGGASTGRSRAGGGFDAFYTGFLAPTEGGYADRDGASGAPVNFGVNQKFNPDIDVRSLTQDRAREILRQRYWEASGADKLPAGLAEVHGDTAVNMGVGAAKRLLAASGGDPERYLQLRERRYRSLGGPSLRSWLNRNNSLREYVGLQDGGAPQTGQPGIINVRPPKRKDAPSGYEWSGNRLTPISGGPADPAVKRADKSARPPTEAENKGAGYLAAAVAAQNTLNSVSGYNPSEYAFALDALANGNPLRRDLSQVDRRVLNAQMSFAGAALRLESGAVVTDAEIARKARQLFPLPGDGPEVQADKRAQREAALRSFRLAAGVNADAVPRVRPNPRDRNQPGGGLRIIGIQRGGR